MDDARTKEAGIFAEALQLPPAQRPEYLARACGSDQALRQRVEELLRVQGRVGDFLERPNAESGFSIAISPEEKSGRVGRYRLIEKIGEGGCGVVYLAEQDEPVRRQVALKIIKPGMDTREVITRFEAERQALAMMDHPGIAKVFDAGQTESGRPFFIMELIRGTKITDYCDEHALSTEARLKLFVQVCQAIQHAHQKGVIHRDIKPSNILVTTSAEGTPQPVVIDFGIAKATVGVHLTDRTLFTAVDMLIGTPTYMSPEQTTASSSDVDTRADIYSLGVLLYELLTGTTPFDAGELLQLGIDEVRRAIREQDPLRPSARLSKMTGEELTAVAQRRQAEPPTLVREVSGDLDWIAMKALEKDRARRYPTANDLATDVGRYLVDETIAARPATAFYRLRKTIARHQLLFAGIGVIALLIVGALLAVSVAFTRERRARAEAEVARAQAEAARTQAEADRTAAQEAAAQSQQATGLLVRTFQTVNPGNTQGKDTALLRLLLDDAAKRIDTELAKYPGPRAELQSTIGSVYANLDLFDAALPLLEASVRSARERYGPVHAQVADASERLGHLWMKMNRYPEADAAYREALDIQRKVHGDKPHPDVADLLRALGGPAWGLGRLDQAEVYARQAWAMLQATVGEDHRDSRTTMNSLAALAEIRLNLADAEAFQRKLAAYHRTQPNNKVFLANTLDIVGRIIGKSGRPNLAVDWELESLQVQREVGAQPSFMRVRTQRNLSNLFLLADRLPESEKALEEAEATLKAMPATESADLAFTLEQRSLLSERLGRLEEAEKTARSQWEVTKKMGLEHSRLDWLERLASLLVASGRAEEAEALFAALPASVTAQEIKNDEFFSVRSLTRAQMGRWSEAVADARIVHQLSPTDPVSAWRLTPLLVVTADRAGYSAHITTMLKAFGETRTPILALRVAFDATILPDAPADTVTVQRLADTALGGEMEGNWAAQAELVKALAEYRSGNIAAAQTRAAQAARSLRPDLRAMAESLRALCLHRQQLTDEAAAALAQAEEIVATKLPPAEAKDFGAEWRETIQGDAGTDWKGWIYSRALLAEAKAVIEGR